jgi:hypothetical protein
LIANAERRDNLAKARELLGETPEVDAQPKGDDVPLGPVQPTFVCPHCGASMIVIDTLVRAANLSAHRRSFNAHHERLRPSIPTPRVDSSSNRAERIRFCPTVRQRRFLLAA